MQQIQCGIEKLPCSSPINVPQIQGSESDLQIQVAPKFTLFPAEGRGAFIQFWSQLPTYETQLQQFHIHPTKDMILKRRKLWYLNEAFVNS